MTETPGPRFANDLWSDRSPIEHEALLSTSEQIAQTGSWVWDFANQRVEWSDGMFRLLGLSPEHDEPSVEAFDRAVHPDDWCPFVATREKIIARAKGQILELRIVRPDGAVRNVVLNVAVFTDADGNHVRSVGTALDVTEQKALEAQLHQATKLELVGQLAGGVAHDFNNILTGILGYSEIVEQMLGQQGESDLARMAGHIRKAAENAAGVTSRLMTLVRQQPLNRVPCDVHDVIKETKAILRTAISPEICVLFNATAASSRVLAEASHLQSALLNLGLNARDAIDGSGTITFSTRMVELDEQTSASFQCPCAPGPYVQVAVTDDGSGMSDATVARIFEPFFTTKKNDVGTGLGLASVRETMRAHDGGISVSSTPGTGTSFSLYLPLITSEVYSPAVIGDPVGTGTVLVIDDNESVRGLVQTALKIAGFDVYAEADGEAGLLHFMRAEYEIDAIVMDVMMPGLNGWEVLSRLRQAHIDVPILVISGYTGDVSAESVARKGGTAFLRKPFRRDKLVRQVANLIRDHRARVRQTV